MVNRAERAKQFLSFDALKGLQEALREKEKQLEFVEKVELCEEMIEKLSEKLQILEIGSLIIVKYYCNKCYKEVVGKVKGVDRVKKKLIIEVNGEKERKLEIRFCDIFSIEET